MIRAALYARYSSDNQREVPARTSYSFAKSMRSLERLQIIGILRGCGDLRGSTILRPGIQQLMCDAQHGEFKILLAEVLDRISRDQADVAPLYERLKFAGITIITLAEGEITERLITAISLAENFRERNWDDQRRLG